MEDMNEQSFEQMLGADSIDRMNYIDLLEQSRMHIAANAVVSVMLISLVKQIPTMFDSMDKNNLQELISVTLKAITMAQIKMGKAFASEQIMRHHKQAYGADLDIEELERSTDKEVIRSVMQKAIGWDAVEMMERLVELSQEDDDEEE